MEKPEQSKSPDKKEGQKPRRVFIEIGPGMSPAALIGKRKFGENDFYVGLDHNEYRLIEGRRNLKSAGELNKNVVFLNAYAEKLPLKSETSDEVFLGNVLGDPSIRSAHKEQFMDEAKRILKRGAPS